MWGYVQARPAAVPGGWGWQQGIGMTLSSRRKETLSLCLFPTQEFSSRLAGHVWVVLLLYK